MPAPAADGVRDAAGVTADQTRIRLVWVMLLRVGLISVLLGATLVLNYQTAESFSAPSPRFLLGLIAFTYVATILFAVWYRMGWRTGLLARVQFVIDIGVWGCLAYATGGIGSGFTFLFDLWVIVAAVVLGGRAGFIWAGGAAAALLVLTGLMHLDLLTPLSDQLPVVSSTWEVLYFLGVNVASLFVVAVLVTSLVARLEQTGRGLERERERRADLSALHADTIHSLSVGLATTGSAGEILTINPAGRKILGLEDRAMEEDALGRWLPDLIRLLSDPAAPGARGRGSARTADGQRVPVEYTVTPLLGADGVRRGSIVVFNDLTEVRKLEAELESARRLAALGELAASLAHEIRNPLGAIYGSFQMLASRPQLNDEDRSLSEIILRELDRMERLVGDMLDYARPREPTRRPTDLGRLVDEVLTAFSSGPEVEGRTIEAQQEGDLEVAVDPSQIRQVLWNLLRNAAQATEEGDRIDVRVACDGHAVTIEVGDSGQGIDADDIKRIFDPFYSTRELGLGLGLALCKRIAESHGGRIEAEPFGDGGSVFRLIIPCADSGPAT
jgi:two-component system sensor histidine kinase PilS (NtrC family)